MDCQYLNWGYCSYKATFSGYITGDLDSLDFQNMVGIPPINWFLTWPLTITFSRPRNLTFVANDYEINFDKLSEGEEDDQYTGLRNGAESGVCTDLGRIYHLVIMGLVTVGNGMAIIYGNYW